jgi:hypothetical protein
MARVELGLDVEAHRRVAGLAGQREDVGEGRYALPVRRLLLGEARGVRRARFEPAHVVAEELVPGQREDRGSGRRHPRAGGIAREVGVEPLVVADDHDAVAGHARVQLERADAQGQGAREGGQRVLRREAARATVALEVEGARRRR